MASANIKYDYDTYAYLAITLTPSSPVLADPSRVHPHLDHLGSAGALPDIHVFSVPKRTWGHSSTAIIQALRQADGVLRVDVQEPRVRAKKEGTAGIAQGGPDLWLLGTMTAHGFVLEYRCRSRNSND